MSKYTTTLNDIKSHDPCSDGWRTLLKHLGKTQADDEPLDFEVILESNGLDDALWALRALPDSFKTEIRLLACDFVESVLYLVSENENRPARAVEVARLHAIGQATDSELAAARDAAWAAARDATSWATSEPAWAAVRAAAWAAASDAAWAGKAAAWAAARDAAARDVAWDAASVQKIFVNWLNSREDIMSKYT